MIPFCKTTLGEEEKKAIADVIDSGWVVMGQKTREFEAQFAEYVGSKYAIFVDSGTSALFLALKSLGLKSGYRVSVPSLTFTSTAEIIVNCGGIPAFKDIELNSFCMDHYRDEAVHIPVHLIGNRAKRDLRTPYGRIIYDSAHRIEKNDIVPNDMAIWCYSFYATKNMTTVQGGMIATNRESVADYVRKARDHGISKGTEERYKLGQWGYSVDFVGWREKSDDVHAAIGIEQLKKLPEMTRLRNAHVAHYNALLGLNRTGNHIYPILVNERAKFIEFMKEKGIQCAVHFLPLHKMPAYKKYAKGLFLPNTEYLGERLVSLPLYPQLTEEEINYIVEAIKESGLFIHE